MSVEDSESRRFDLPHADFFRFFFFKFAFVFVKICAHSERYINLTAGIFEIQSFFRNNAFPLSPVLLKKK